MASLLLICREARTRKKIKHLLHQEHEVHVSGTIKEGLRTLRNNSIDLLVIDMTITRLLEGRWLHNLLQNYDVGNGQIAILTIIPPHFQTDPEKENDLISFLKKYRNYIDSYFFDCNQDHFNHIFLTHKIDQVLLQLSVKRNHYLQKEARHAIIVADSDHPSRQGLFRWQGIPLSQQQAGDMPPLSFLAGRSKAATAFEEKMRQCAAHDLPAVILGHQGHEQAHIAHHIHELSDRAGFLSVDLKKIPAHMHEAQLYGYAKNAFAGAEIKTTGILENAGEGTLFLDNIEFLDWNLQGKLIKTLREKKFSRLGEKKNLNLNCRIIFSGPANFEQRVDRGRFRQDLFYHIHTHPLRIPALKDRTEDIPFIAEAYIQWACNRSTGKATDLKIDSQVKMFLMNYRFKHTEQLFETLEDLVRYSEKNTIDLSLLHRTRLLQKEVEQTPAVIIDEEQKQFLRDAPSSEIDHMNLFQGTNNWEAPLSYIEEQYISHVLEKHRYNIAEASRVLGITRKTLYNKIEKYKLSIPQSKSGN